MRGDSYQLLNASMGLMPFSNASNGGLWTSYEFLNVLPHGPVRSLLLAWVEGRSMNSESFTMANMWYSSGMYTNPVMATPLVL